MSFNSPLTFVQNGALALFGVGLMGQDVARKALLCMGVKRLLLVDATADVQVGKERKPLTDFAAGLENPHDLYRRCRHCRSGGRRRVVCPQ